MRRRYRPGCNSLGNQAAVALRRIGLEAEQRQGPARPVGEAATAACASVPASLAPKMRFISAGRPAFAAARPSGGVPSARTWR